MPASRRTYRPLTAVVAIALTAAACGSAPPTPAGTSGVASSAPAATAQDTGTAAGTTAPSDRATRTLRATIESWQLSEPISRAVAFAAGDSILLAGGLTASGTIGTITAIDLASGAITRGGQLIDPVHDAGGALVGGVPMVFGGGNVAPERGVQLVGAHSVVVGELPRARADLVVIDAGGATVIVGGGTPTRLDPAVLSTTDGRAFATVATLLQGVRYPAVASIGDVSYVIGGTDGVHDRREIQAIDTPSGSVRLAGNLPSGLAHATAFVLDGHLLIAGGRAAGVAQDTVWEVDTSSGSVDLVGHLPYAVSDAAGAVVGGVGYLLGGEGRDYLASVVAISFA